MLVLAASLVSGISTTELIDSFNYNFTNGSLSVVSKSDYMLDKNADGTNDTLVIELNATSSSNNSFNFIVNLLDNNSLVANSTSKLITTAGSTVQVNFPSELLQSSKFNYTVEAKTLEDDLVYREYKTQTNEYLKYEKGIIIMNISDKWFNSNLRITVNFSSPKEGSVNYSITLNYNSSSISKTWEGYQLAGNTSRDFDFDETVLLGTHYSGNFTISKITVDQKTFNLNYNTSNYSYEQFQDGLSYIKSFSSNNLDFNSNNLSEFLEINFTFFADTVGVYNITHDLYDPFDGYVLSANITTAALFGMTTISTRINGSDIYKTGINGPYTIKNAKLLYYNITHDGMQIAHTTKQLFYTDFERPPLPDLQIAMSTSFDSLTNVTNITINLSNLGASSAFNVFFDIFDNITYNNNRSISFLSNGEKVTYQFNITNSSNISLITAIVDFDNLVDEANESNNIAQNMNASSSSSSQSTLDVNGFSLLNENVTMRILEFGANNTGGSALNNINWSLNTGQGTISASTLFNANSGQNTFVFVNYNYSDSAVYTAIASGVAASSSDSQNFVVGGIDAHSLNILNESSTKRIFEFSISNYLGSALSAVSWSFDTKNSNVINSSNSATVASNSRVFVYIDYNYTSSGIFNSEAIGRNNTLSNSDILTVTI